MILNEQQKLEDKIFLNFVEFYNENLCERWGLIVDTWATWLKRIQPDSPEAKNK